MLTADKFLDYLDQRWRAFVDGEGNVPCGTCRGCCRAGYAIGLSPAEAAVIPHHTLEGHAVILPMPDGACPYLVEEKCSIYASRPASCRQFDCRDFAVASLRINAAMGGTKDQVKGVAEINASIERFHAEHGALASTEMSKHAQEMVQQGGMNAVAAAQGVLVLTMMAALPPADGQKLMQLLLGPDEAARGAGMAAVDRLREAERGQPA